MQALFNKCNPKGGKLSAKQFEALVSMLSEIETSANQTGPSAGAAAPGVPPSAAVLGQMKDQGRVQGVVDLTPRDQRTDVILSPPSKTIGRAATTAASDSSNPQDDEEAAAVAEAFQVATPPPPALHINPLIPRRAAALPRLARRTSDPSNPNPNSNLL